MGTPFRSNLDDELISLEFYIGEDYGSSLIAVPIFYPSGFVLSECCFAITYPLLTFAYLDRNLEMCILSTGILGYYGLISSSVVEYIGALFIS